MRPAHRNWAGAAIFVALISFWLGRAQTVELRTRVRQLEDENRGLRQKIDGLSSSPQMEIAANERTAITALRTIVTACVVYMAETGSGFPASLEELGPTSRKLLDEKLAAGQSTGYRIVYLPRSESGSNAVTAFELSARPIRPEETGKRSFYADETGLIRHTADLRAATRNDPPL